MALYGLERDIVHSDADNVTTIPVLLGGVLAEIALVWFEQGNDDIIVVDTDETCAAIKDAFTDTRTLLEPAGALGIAGLKKYVAETGIVDETLDRARQQGGLASDALVACDRIWDKSQA